MYKNHAAQVFFVSFFSAFLSKNRKKYDNFLQFFLVVYQQVTKNLKKKFVKTLDRFEKCCIFASLFDIKQDNKTTTNQNNNNNKKQKEK